MLQHSVILMGVSSTGKSSVGKALADLYNLKFIDGDDLHPKANILKMAAGRPLNDADRAPWLERIRDAVFSLDRKHEAGIIVCSALKKDYRDALRDGNPNLTFLHLHADFDVILERMQARKGHFIRPEMLQSQFATLEFPTNEKDVAYIEVSGDFDQVVTAAGKILESWGAEPKSSNKN